MPPGTGTKTAPGQSSDVKQSTPIPGTGLEPTVLLRCDLLCVIKLDGQEIGQCKAGESVVHSVSVGQHRIEASIPGWPVIWENEFKVSPGGQVLLDADLKSLFAKNMSGGWHWEQNSDAEEYCGVYSNENNWTIEGTDLTLKRAMLYRASVHYRESKPDEKTGCDDLKTKGYDCHGSFELTLSFDKLSEGIRFAASPSTESLRDFTIYPDFASEASCRKRRDYPPPHFTGTLLPASNSQLKLILDYAPGRPITLHRR
jgi:hypothetical protein